MRVAAMKFRRRVQCPSEGREAPPILLERMFQHSLQLEASQWSRVARRGQPQTRPAAPCRPRRKRPGASMGALTESSDVYTSPATHPAELRKTQVRPLLALRDVQGDGRLAVRGIRAWGQTCGHR